ncbi:MAG TPA: hypothetical protein VFM70_02710 [Salinimicrobium sp.]|nr:hypothetical protein [Salinimicrobium sp.]
MTLNNNISFRSTAGKKPTPNIFEAFRQRVQADGGTFEDNGAVETAVRNWNSNRKLLITPTAYKSGKAYSIIPKDGSGDATVDRNCTATFVDSNGIPQTAALNELRIDHSTGEPCILVEGQATNYVSKRNFQLWGVTRATATDLGDNIYSAVATDLDPILSLSTGYFGISGFFKVEIKGVGSSIGKNARLFVIRDAFSEIKQLPFVLTGDWQTIEIPYTFSAIPTTKTDVRIDFVDSAVAVGDTAHLRNPQLSEISTSYIPTNGAIATRLADTVTIPIPTGTTQIIETLSDDTENIITTIPATYTIPVGLFKKIEMFG